VFSTQSEYDPYFRIDSRLFPTTEFLVEVLQHLPDSGAGLIRRYGLYSSRSRGTRSRKPQPALHLDPARQDALDQSVSAVESRAAWVRLLAKVYEVDLIGGSCLRCERPVITDPQQVFIILRHLIKTGAAPPGLRSPYQPLCASTRHLLSPSRTVSCALRSALQAEPQPGLMRSTRAGAIIVATIRLCSIKTDLHPHLLRLAIYRIVQQAGQGAWRQ
jgi:hypothetical protein